MTVERSSEGLIRRSIAAAEPALDPSAPRSERIAAGAKVLGAVAGVTLGVTALTDGVVELQVHESLVHNAFVYAGPAPAITAGIATGLVACVSLAFAMERDGDFVDHAASPLHTFLHRSTIAAYAGGTGLTLLGLGADFAGSTGMAGMGTTGHVLIDSGVSAAALGVITHIGAAGWKRVVRAHSPPQLSE